MSDFISNRNKVHSGQLNKTYQQNFNTRINLTTTLRDVHTFPELTIQADRKVRISFYVPAIGGNIIWRGIYLAYNIKLNGTQLNLGTSGKSVSMMYGARWSTGLNNAKILDFVGANAVQPGQEYKIQLSIRAKMLNGDSRFISGVDANLSGKGKGTRLESARNQNYMNFIIEELSR